MKKAKWLSVLSTSALVASLFATGGAPQIASAQTDQAKFNVDRYGDESHIDSYLNSLSKSEDFQKEAEKIIKAQADEVQADAGEEAADSPFTYDGGTKFFLNRNLELKKFTLRSVGDNIEIWVAQDLEYGPNNPKPADVVTQEQVEKMREEFDNNIYKTATEFFGTPEALDGSGAPLPGMLGLPDDYYGGSDKVIMLVDNVQDEGWDNPNYPFFVAGFFWQTIENYTHRNIVTIDSNSWGTRLESTYYGTLIHEFQHLIQADNDPSEESWINEGMSTFSEYLGGYGSDAGSINFYLDHPENSLVNWDEHALAETGPETIADYGQGYLFMLYLYDRFGKEFMRDLAVDGTAQGIVGVENQLKALNTGITFKDLYQDFITAVALDDPSAGDQYDIDNIDLRSLPVDKNGTPRGKTVDFEKALTYEKSGVPAWGGDFKEIDLGSDVKTIKFDGSAFLPMQWQSVEDPLGSGDQVLWGNSSAEADNSLIFEADLTNETSPVLSFDHYYNIEEQWDFAAVQVSTDNGETWTSLENDHTRSDVVEEGYPTIKENVPGFSGTNGDWTNEQFDLSAYAGQKVLVNFRYMTDWGYQEDGWFVKNIQVGDFANDGSSVDAFKSLGEVKGEYVDFTVSFIQTLKNGKTKVYKVDPFNVTDQDALNMQKLFSSANGEPVKMITSYAAKPGDILPVDYSYEVVMKSKGPNKSNGNGKGNSKNKK